MRKTWLIAGFVCLFGSALMADTAQTIPFLANMLPANETPPLTDAGSSNVIVLVHVIRDGSGAVTSGSVDFDISTKFANAVTVTGLHIHNAAAGLAGPIVVPTDVNATDKSIAIDATGRTRIQKQVQFPQTSVTLSTIQDLLNNPQNFYVNIHTTDHPSGAMRGQLLPAEMKILMGLMNGANETPPLTHGASAIATVTVLRARSGGNVVGAAVIFNAEYTGFDSSSGTTFTGFHIHNGLAGNAGPVVINTGIAAGANSVTADASGTGNLNYIVPVTPQDPSFATEVGTINGLFDNPSGHYINLHTTVAPGGVVRDQMRNTDANNFQITMLPANETPPITALAVIGTASIPVYTLRNADGSVAAGTVIFDINFRGFPAPTSITGLHIHGGPPGLAGSIVIPTPVGSGAASVTTDTGNGNVFRIVTVASASGISSLNNLVQNPGAFYANMHTAANPGGAMRAQLAGAPVKPVVGGAAATSSTVTNAAPGSILSLYGTNLATTTSNLDGLPRSVTRLPTSMNGVSATIAGLNAPFYFVSPGQLNVQVPFEVTAGSQPVIVSTAGGPSAAFNITVAGLAPSIFVVDAGSNLGAILKNNDFSLVTAANPARAGDVILIYSTGLGQTTPLLQTGSLQGAPSGTNSTVSVSVTMGGRDLTPIYSIAAPGSAGLYQTAVTVPSGLTGTVPVVLKAGTFSSNSVNVAVQ